MNHETIKQVAELLGADNVKPPSSSGWVQFNCPFAPWDHEKATDNTPSFGFCVVDDGESPAHCWSCNFSGSLTNVIQQLKFRKADLDFKELMEIAQVEFDGGTLPSLPDVEIEPHKLYPFPEKWLKSFPPVAESGLGTHYLQTRKGGPVPHSVIEMLDLRWDPFRNRVCFPIRGANGTLYGLHGRAVKSSEELKYLAYNYQGRLNPQVWLGEETVDWDRPVVMAESVFDLARVKQVYRNVISPLKAGVNELMLSRVKSAFEIVTLFDPDKAGGIARKKVGEWAKFDKGVKRIVRHAHLDDYVDENGKAKDGGDLCVEEMADVLGDYVPLDEILT